MRLAIIALIFGSTLLVLGDEDASDPEYVHASAEDLSSLRLKPGVKVKVRGKYKELIDLNLVLFDCNARLVLKSKDMIKQILNLKATRDNVVLTGVVSSAGETIEVEVEEISAAPSDSEVFVEDLGKILRMETGRSAARFGLGKRLLKSYTRSKDPEVKPIIHRVLSDSATFRGETMDPARAEEWVQLVREMHDLLGDKAATLEALIRLEEKYRAHPSVLKFLSELNCRKYRGSWVTYEDLKRQEGFVEHQGAWIPLREKLFLETLQEFRTRNTADLILRKRTEREYQALAERGKVEEGMRLEEASVALGFPDRVERRLFQKAELTQWIYGAKCCYFLDGLLVKKFAP
ncbi:MAG TPA: hypothetical protein VMT52_18030 [Planctomycetota bacterium]|nr:hypothetical protein [Planctomycetota bacterium]